MGLPVVTVASGGLPVNDQTSGGGRGLAVTEATYGIAVTKVSSGGLGVVYVSATGGGTATPGPEATAFLARTSGLDATHTNAYTVMINGLVADGIWTKLDVLYIFATQDSTTAKLNLVSTSYPAVANGAPTFTADRGYTGTENSTSIYIDTGFDPTVGSPRFARDSGHLSLWVLTNAQGTGGLGYGISSTISTYIIPRFTDDNCYFRINTVGAGGPGDNVANADSRGHYIANRSGASAQQGYKNGSSVVTNTVASVIVTGGQKFFALGYNNTSTPKGYGQQEAMLSIGSSLSSTDAANFYARLRTYMTAVGVP